MSVIIELMSTDDEEDLIPPGRRTPEAATTPAPILEKKPTAIKQQEKVPQNECRESIVAKENPGTEPNKSNTAASQQQQDQRARRRKSQHQTVRTSPEIEFESLYPQEEIERKSNLNTLKTKSVPKKKNIKKISILASKPLTCEQLLDIELQRFLKEDATLNVMREIAAERVRINQLLSLNCMPEIKFSLYTKREMLEFQISERFKQKEICMKSLSDTTPKKD